MQKILNSIYLKPLIFFLLASFSGCVTSKIEYVEPEKIPANKTYKISVLNLKNGTAIDVKDKEAKLKLKYKGVSNVIVYYEDGNIERTVSLNDIAWLKIEILESNQVATSIALIGITASVLFIGLLITLGSGGLGMH